MDKGNRKQKLCRTKPYKKNYGKDFRKYGFKSEDIFATAN